MFVATVTLAALLNRCAPNVGERTMTAIVRVESDANPLAIHDNTTLRSFAPRTLTEASGLAESLVAAGHSIDIGLGQINSNVLATLGLSVRDAFDPCTNLHAGATVLAAAYANAAQRLGPGALALRRAIGAYNTGSIFAGDAYIERVLGAAGLPENDRRMPDLEPSATPARGPAAPAILRAASVAPQPHGRASAAATPAPVAANPVATPLPSADPYVSALLVSAVAPSAPAGTPAAASGSPTPAPAPAPTGSH